MQRFGLDIRKERLIRTGEARSAAAAADGRIQRLAGHKPAPLVKAAPLPLAAVRGPAVPLVRPLTAPVTQDQRVAPSRHVAPAQQQPRMFAPLAAQQGLPAQQLASDLQGLLAQQQGPPAQLEPTQRASAQQQGALEAPAQQGMPAQQQQQLAAEQRRKQQLQLHQITMMKRQLMRAQLEVLPPNAWRFQM